ncbi:MAG: glycosyltransferase [Fibrobacter sp.]|nr:glycosyltransferase [Fibrobacter sp.]
MMKQYELIFFSAQSGIQSALLQKVDDNSTIHLHSIVDPEHEADFFQDLDLWGDRIIFLGTGMGYHLTKLVLKAPPDAKFLFIDYFEDLVRICAEKFKSLTLETISSETQEPEVKLREFLRDGEKVQYVKHPPSYAANRQFYDRIFNTYSKAGCINRKSGRILVLYGNFFLQQEVCNALKHNGLEPVMFDYRQLRGTQDYQSELQRSIQEANPEFILSINMLGFDGNGALSDIAEKYGIPVGVWFVDDPHPILLHQQHFIRSSMTAFCWERYYIPFLKTMKFHNVVYLPLATDPELFSPAPKKEFYAEIGFIGSSMGTEFLQTISRKFLWNDLLLPLVEKSAAALLMEPKRPVESIVDEIAKELNIELPFSDLRNRTWLHSYIIHTASMKKRKEIIGSLTALNINTFGDPTGWKRLIGNLSLAWPDIDYRTGLASYYRGITININITSCQMKTAVNQRVFDVPACGGFLITDYQDDISQLFDENEIVVYGSVDELKEKIDYFKNHESDREKISSLAREKILKEHTYYNRLLSVCDCMRSSAM